MKRIVGTVLATFFGIGYLRPAPGTWGSLAAIPIGVLILLHFTAVHLAALAILTYLLGVWASGVHANATGRKDPSEVVLDEAAGQWLALAFIAPIWWQVVLAFALFRLFDIWKPWVIGRAESLPEGWGIMTDDMISGLVAGVIVLLCRLWLPI